MANNSSLEVLIQTFHINGTQTLRGICGNGAYSKLLPIVAKPAAANEASLKRTIERLTKACAAQPQFQIAFEDLERAQILITQGKKGSPNLIESEWTCGGEKKFKTVDVTAPDAPLPTPEELVKRAKEMSDMCGMRIREARLP